MFTINPNNSFVRWVKHSSFSFGSHFLFGGPLRGPLSNHFRSPLDLRGHRSRPGTTSFTTSFVPRVDGGPSVGSRTGHTAAPPAGDAPTASPSTTTRRRGRAPCVGTCGRATASATVATRPTRHTVSSTSPQTGGRADWATSRPRSRRRGLVVVWSCLSHLGSPATSVTHRSETGPFYLCSTVTLPENVSRGPSSG